MKHLIPILLCFLIGQPLYGQRDDERPRFFLGASFGTSYPIRNFAETDLGNPNAGFAENGRKIDFYGGRPLGDRTTITAVFRYQSFETEIEDLIATFNADNPGAEFSGNTEDWETYNLLVGLAYRVTLTRRFSVFPRFGIGPLVANNPGININSPNTAITNNFSRTSESGFGLGVELGIGLQTNLGKRFSLMPTFTFSRGFVTIPDVVTITDNVIVTADYQPVIQTFNLGLSLAYKFF